MNLDVTPARLRLDRALDGLTVAFRGMTARPDESNCACHWGSAEELAQPKAPDGRLDADLLRRTWQAVDWKDHGAVLRRVLPQFSTALVRGLVEPGYGLEEAARSFARGHWQRWPARHSAAVWEFLHAWWAHTLTEPDPVVPAYEVLTFCAEASATMSPWLTAWEDARGPVADQHLAETADRWQDDMLCDELPWDAWENEEEMRTALATWLVTHGTARLRAHGVGEELLDRIQLLRLTGLARWEHPHWPFPYH
ncbi:hypothetical protein BLA24_06880 [Streptomyces cinnamoneus]|uniref:Uncharacterized protein n=1 Tax=Streptomyces cinnamoneus TaxID=53446 RepID=A0A2G1XMP9_STRCJ|nr:hypothetical protein [Streptomyces cinnamoneus]PHQ52496.1 hypothetical protein BLA24_06880 [Streptomyces cinnamoneus]PPT16030.1 hypothetical protein CYQ11_27030 [Streptomyces cinnamoneus]